jgi:hypothetical protein
VVAEAFLFDRGRLDEVLDRIGIAYATAQPFPHAVIDGLVPDAVLDEVVAEFPAPGGPGWLAFDSPTERKLASLSDATIGPAASLLLAQLNVGPFVGFLERLTGIDGLVPDPFFLGGGLHQVERGGYLEVHADFNRHPTTGLDRRLNVLLYLNRDWREEYGGHLELWDGGLTRCHQRIAPQFGRCVVFSTTSFSFHGHPQPLECPPGTTRKSLALYYYSNGRPAGEVLADHNTRWRDAERHRSRWRGAARRLRARRP